MQKQLNKTILEGISSGVFFGAAAAVFCNGKTATSAEGSTFEGAGQAIRTDHLFDVASVTKSIPTGILANQALEAGLVELDTPLKEFLPELNTSFREEVLFKHLLTHTLDYRLSLSSLKDLSPEEIWDRLMNFTFEQPPGTSYLYCNASSLILGRTLERMFGATLETLANEKIFVPLGLKRTTFHPLERFRREEIVPTERDPWRGRLIRGEVHDESAYAMRDWGAVGSAGLFSTVEDLIVVLSDLLACFRGEGVLMGRETMRNMIANHAEPAGIEAALGWERNNKRFMGAFGKDLVIGKTGFTGSQLVMNFTQSKAGVLLTNYTWPHRKKEASLINAYRNRFNDFLWGMEF